LGEPLNVGKIITHDAHTAYKKVLMYADCSKTRDQIDKRIVDETMNGTARFIGRSKYNGEGGNGKVWIIPEKE
jgi:hypothetical protein